ncbi:alpha/beta hydrolase (plasmid) [Streptomyces sp. QH1-20]|uniref:alpha/beta hydrolase n=1 Tax=Streptomyces sp. QH1-20 TaxID=3240934 RepID=UPI0035193BF4
MPPAEVMEPADESAPARAHSFAALHVSNLRALVADMKELVAKSKQPTPEDPASVEPQLSHRDVGDLASDVVDVLVGNEPGLGRDTFRSGATAGKPAPADLEANADHLSKVVAGLTESKITQRILSYERDFEGVGRMAVAIGDIETATHVGILVPGMGSGPSNLQKFIDRARAVYDECLRVAPETNVAVVAWQGYRAPRDIRKGKGEVLSDELAQAGSRLLISDLAHWGTLWRDSAARKVAKLPERPQITLNPHSYGSVVVGNALRKPTAPGGIAGAAKGAVNGFVRELLHQAVQINPVTAGVQTYMKNGDKTEAAAEALKRAVKVAQVATDPSGFSAGQFAWKPGGSIFKRSLNQARAGYTREPLGGGEADYLVLFGSPGTGGTAEDLAIAPWRIFAAAHTKDDVSNSNHFGPDPTHVNFDRTGHVTRLKSEYTPSPGSSRTDHHTSYYDPGRESLTNLAHIIVGNPHKVTRSPKRDSIWGGRQNPLGWLVTNSPTTAKLPDPGHQAPHQSAAEPETGTRRSKRSTDDLSGGREGSTKTAPGQENSFKELDEQLRGTRISPEQQATASEMVDRAIREGLEAKSGLAEAQTVNLDAPVSVLYRPSSPATGLELPNTTRQTRIFTVRQVVLGEIQRENDLTRSGWRLTLVNRPGGMSTALWEAVLSNDVRQQVGDRILQDALKVIDTPQVKSRFLSYARHRVMGALARHFATSRDGSHLSNAVTEAMASEEGEARLVIFNGQVVPNLVAFPYSLDLSQEKYTRRTGKTYLIVSVATGEARLLPAMSIPVGWEQFVRAHLSAYESGRASSVDFRPSSSWHFPRNTDDELPTGSKRLGTHGFFRYYSAFSFRKSGQVYEDLWEAGLTTVRTDMDALSYTPEEQRRDADLRFRRNLASAVCNLATLVALGLTGGAALAVSLVAGGASIASSVFQRQLGEVADRGEERRAAEEDAALGMVFAIAGMALDVGATARLLVKAAPAAKAAAAKKLRWVVTTGRETCLINRIKWGIPGGLPGRTPRERVAGFASALASDETLVKKAFQKSDVCWDAVLRVEELSQVTTAAEVSRLRAATRADRFSEFLGGPEMKAVANSESLRLIPVGERVGIVSADGTQMLHAMTSTGQGRMAGLNNAGVNPRLSPGYVEFDLDQLGLKFDGDGGWTLAAYSGRPVQVSRRPVRVYVHADAPEFRIESMHRLDDGLAELTVSQSRLSDSLLASARDHGEIGPLMLKPSENCEKLMKPVAEFAESEGFTNIRYAGMDIWDNGGPTMNNNHFVVIGSRVGKKTSTDWVFDLSAGQFAGKMDGVDGPLILPIDAWLARYRQNPRSNRLIKMEKFSTRDRATAEFTSQAPRHALDYREGAQLVTRPSWYEPAMKSRPADRTVRFSVRAPGVPEATATAAVGGAPTVSPVAGQPLPTVDVAFRGLLGEAADLVLHPRVRFHIKYVGRIVKIAITPTRDTSATLLDDKGKVLAHAQAEETKTVESPIGVPLTLDVVPVYTVQSGDTLRDVAYYELYDRDRWTEIYALNRHVIGPLEGGQEYLPAVVGQVWHMPEPDPVHSQLRTSAWAPPGYANATGAPAGASPTLEVAPTYTVQPGDTLRSVAYRELGNAARWQEIYALNKDAIANPPHLHGPANRQVWRMPEKNVAPNRTQSKTYWAGPGLPLLPSLADSTFEAAVLKQQQQLDILEQLDKPRRIRELATALKISSATVDRHLAALRGAGLTTETKSGRNTTNSRTPQGTQLLRRRQTIGSIEAAVLEQQLQIQQQRLDILRQLDRPRSTGELAAILKISYATTQHHVAALRTKNLIREEGSSQSTTNTRTLQGTQLLQQVGVSS